MDQNIIFTITALFLTVLGFAVTIWVVFINNKLNQRLAESQKHEAEHEEIKTTLGVHTTEISFNRHEINNMQTENQYKNAVSEKTVEILIRYECLLKAICTKLDIPANDYIKDSK